MTAHRRLPLGTIGLGVIYVALLWLQIAPGIGRLYDTDSYAYVVLGRGLVARGTLDTYAVRDFHGVHAVPQPSRSFPPGYPALVGVVDRATGAGIASGVWVDLAALALTIAAGAMLGRAVAGPRWRWLFVAVPVFVATNAAYREEIAYGGSLPVMLLLFVVALAAAARSLRDAPALVRCAAALGALLAVSVLTRFDGLLSGAALAVVVMGGWARIHGIVPARRAALALVAAGLVVYGPWAVRSVRLFGSPFASDNGMTAVTTHTGGNLAARFYAPGKMPATVREEPRRWATQRAGYLVRNAGRVVKHTAIAVVLLAIVLVPAWRRLDDPRRVLLLALAAHAIVSVATVSLTPYRDPRYLSPAQLDVLLMLFLVLEPLAAYLAERTPRRASRFGVARLEKGLPALVAVAIAAAALPLLPNVRGYQVVPRRVLGREGYEAMASQLRATVAPNELIAVPSAEPFTYATGMASIHVPRNVRVDDPNFRAWLAAWRPAWILQRTPWVQQMKLEGWRVTAFQNGAWWLLRVPESARVDPRHFADGDR